MSTGKTLPNGIAVALVLIIAAWGVFSMVKAGAERDKDNGRIRAALAAAGHPDARIGRGQRLRAMSRCDVGQIRKRGAAYEWRTDWASGVYCAPADGRPDRILIDGQEP
jgi:hypothetical protein